MQLPCNRFGPRYRLTQVFLVFGGKKSRFGSLLCLYMFIYLYIYVYIRGRCLDLVTKTVSAPVGFFA